MQLVLLELKGNRIKSITNPLFIRLVNLQHLNLYGNPLGTIPGNALVLPELRYLNLSDAGLTTLEVGTFAGTPKLEELQLVGNHFKVLPATIFAGLAVLEELSLSNNELETLPELEYIPRLQAFSAAHNALSSLPSYTFSKSSYLKRLDISYNRIIKLDIKLFEKLGALESLDLSNNKIAVAPGGVFNSLWLLKKLNLSSNQLRWVPLSIIILPSLVQLIFKDEVGGSCFADKIHIKRLSAQIWQLFSYTQALQANRVLIASALHSCGKIFYPLVRNLAVRYKLKIVA